MLFNKKEVQKFTLLTKLIHLRVVPIYIVMQYRIPSGKPTSSVLK